MSYHAEFCHDLKSRLKDRQRRVGPPRRGSVLGKLVFAISLLLLIAVGSAYFLRPKSGDVLTSQPIVKSAVVGEFVATIAEQGQIQSADNVEFRCEIKARYGNPSVIYAIEEGKVVKEGDVLIRLDSSKIEEFFQTQQIAVNNADKRVKQAESALEAAKVAKEEYLKGKFIEQQSTIQNSIFEAEENLRKAEEFAFFTERLGAKGYATELQVEAAFFAVEKSRKQLEQAKLSLGVLQVQTKLRQTIELDSAIAIKSVELTNEKKSYEVEVAQLKEIEEQLGKCVITVPPGVAGQVVYANIFSSRGNSEFVLEQGALVKEQQVLVRLPNLEKMQVYVRINEAQIASVKVGQPVKIEVDALRGVQAFRGEVIKVNPYAEPESWSSGGVRTYGAICRIENPIPELRPSMNALATIETRYGENALMVPIQAVYERKDQRLCLVKTGESYEWREVVQEATNGQSAWLKSGVEEGEEVVLAPKNYVDIMKIPSELAGPGTDTRMAEFGHRGTKATQVANRTAVETKNTTEVVQEVPKEDRAKTNAAEQSTGG